MAIAQPLQAQTLTERVRDANHKGMTVEKGTHPYFHVVTAGVDKEDLEEQQHDREGLLTGGASTWNDIGNGIFQKWVNCRSIH